MTSFPAFVVMPILWASIGWLVGAGGDFSWKVVVFYLELGATELFADPA